MNAELLDDIQDSFEDFWDLIGFNGGTIVDWAKDFASQNRPSQANLIALYLVGLTRDQPTLVDAWTAAKKILLPEEAEVSK